VIAKDFVPGNGTKSFAIMNAHPPAHGQCGCRGAWVNAAAPNPLPLLAVLITRFPMLVKLQ
jgi:hypothetical protein